MSFWDIFKNSENKSNYHNDLHQKVASLLPLEDEKEHILIACIAGLMARVAYVDFRVCENEEAIIEKSLKTWTKLNNEEVAAVKKLALEEINSLAGLENHLYCHPLNEILNNDQKFELLEALFALAAGDGEVEQKESEEIRLITKGLILEPKYFAAARATVIEHLKSLK